MSANETVVRVDGLWKKYCKSLKRSAFYTLADAARGAFGLPSHADRLRKEEFWALRDINFALKRGECLGLIGPNGAGKTTLLKVLGGMIEPDRGRAEVRGRVGTLIQLGAGFHMQLTGRENIYVNGAILGMSRREIRDKLGAIVEFADIGEFIESPVKFYSSGMLVRLGFAIAIHIEPELLLIDEVLAVGDVSFRARCFERMDELRRSSCAMVFVSHAMHMVGRICEKACFLHRGCAAYLGDTDEAISRYLSAQSEVRLAEAAGKGVGMPYLVEETAFQDEAGNQVTAVECGDTLRVKGRLRCVRPLGEGFANLSIKSSEGLVCSECRSPKLDLSAISPGERMSVELRLPNLALMPGVYWLKFVLLGPSRVGYVANTDVPYQLRVKGRMDRAGVVHMPHSWSFSGAVGVAESHGSDDRMSRGAP